MANDKKHFFLRLNPPRLSFALDMSDHEREVMYQHIAYWTPYLNDGTLIVYGPVMDPKGGFGMAVLAADTLEQARELANNDPASKLGSYDVFPMRAVTKQS